MDQSNHFGFLGVVFFAVAGCAPVAAESITPTTVPPTARPSPSAPPGTCVPMNGEAVAPTSVLVPGPASGMPASTASGERLVLFVTLLDAACQPAAGISVHIWHTDAAGEYGPGHGGANLECCYYQGTVRTDENGRFELDTVRPGSYAGVPAPPPAHIHLDAGQGPTEVVFAGDPALPPNAGSDGTSVVELEWVVDAAGGYWTGSVTIVIGSP